MIRTQCFRLTHAEEYSVQCLSLTLHLTQTLKAGVVMNHSVQFLTVFSLRARSFIQYCITEIHDICKKQGSE